MASDRLIRRWKLKAVTVCMMILLAFFFAYKFPWTGAFLSVVFIGVAIWYAASPVQSARIASLLGWPNPSVRQRLRTIAPLGFIGLVLLASSYICLGANARAGAVREEVARELTNAAVALESNQIEEAMRICDTLESKVDKVERHHLNALRQKAELALELGYIENANKEVQELLRAGRRYVFDGQLDRAEAALQGALGTPLATDFEGASALAQAIVAEHMKLATAHYEARELVDAKEHAVAALQLSASTDTSEAVRFIRDIANTEVARLVTTARTSLANDDPDGAAVTLQNALEIPDATELSEAQELLESIWELREKDANARVSSLLKKSQKLIETKQYHEAISQLNLALEIQYSTRHHEISAKISEVERNRAAEESLAKAVQVAKQREAEARARKQHLDQFMERLEAFGGRAAFVDSVSVANDTLVITVTNVWHVTAYQIRLQAAQNLQTIWASVSSPNEADNAHISIVDFNGNEVGGSRILAGSLIWVQEDK